MDESKENGDAEQSDQSQNGSEGRGKKLLTRIQTLWSRYGVTWPQYKLIFKYVLAPTIALAAFQGSGWSNEFSTLGYLLAVLAILSSVSAPRAKFLQTMFIQLVLVSISFAITTFAFFCIVKARTGARSAPVGDTSGIASKGARTTVYNSSSSAVTGIWLFVQIYIFSVLRARLPQYAVPCIMAIISINVSMTYAPQFGQFSEGATFIVSLMKTYYVAFALATGVSLLIFPLTSRHLIRSDIEAYISGFQSALKANLVYIESLESTDMFAAQRTNTAGEKPQKSPEARDFAAKMEKLSATLAKLQANLPFAKREVAIGKLGPDDLQRLLRLMRECIIPMTGLSCMPAIFEQTSHDAGWDRSVSFANISIADAANDNEKARIEAINQWHELLKLLREPFSSITETLNDGLEHALITLEIPKGTKKSTTHDDSEADGDKPRPGQIKFTEHYRRQRQQFQESKQLMLRGFCRIHGIELSEDFFTESSTKDFEAPAWMNDKDHFTPARRALRRQLMIVLYIESLLQYVSDRILGLIVHADELRDSGKLSKRRLIVPGLKRVRKWIYSSLFQEQDTAEAGIDNDFNGSSTSARLGDAYKQRKNPEHLPPANSWERFTDKFRSIPHFFGSQASKFAFRVSLATMSVAVINLLSDTQVFFTHERLFWAQIMASIGMNPSAGQSLRTLVLRSTGTVAALALSYIAYYIVDGDSAGVLVFYFLFLHVGAFIVIKHPAIVTVGVVVDITLTLIVGYKLQAKQIGYLAAVSNGQRFDSEWLLGLTRLATVLAGLFVAWIFTIFPYPITEHSQLRKSLGSTIYLLANYYSIVHETVQLRLRGIHSRMDDEESPERQLHKQRIKVYSKCHILLGELRSQTNFVKYDIPTGGKFPIELYKELISNVHSVLNFMALISVASIPFADLDNGKAQEHGSKWLRDFRKVIGSVALTSQSVTTLLSLLSSAINSGNPLPPYVRVPEPYQLSQRLDASDRDILSIRHIAEPGYASFSVIQLGTKCLLDELQRLLDGVKDLVGELDFSYSLTNNESTEVSQETLTYTTSRTNTTKTGKTD